MSHKQKTTTVFHKTAKNTMRTLVAGWLVGVSGGIVSAAVAASNDKTDGKDPSKDSSPRLAQRFVLPPLALFNPTGAARQLLPGNNVTVNVGGDVSTDYSNVLGAGGGSYFYMPTSPSGNGNLFRVVVNGENNDFNPTTRTIGYEAIYGGRITFFSVPTFQLQRAYLYFGAGIWTPNGHVPFGVLSLGKDFGVLTRYGLDGASALPPGAMKNWQWHSVSKNGGAAANNSIVEGYGRSSPDNFDTSAKLAYQTPVIYGFSAAVSYGPKAVLWSQNNWGDNQPTHSDIVDAVLNYHLNAKTINHQFLIDIMGGYQHAGVFSAYSAQNNQFFDTVNGAFKAKFIKDVTDDAVRLVPLATAQQTAVAAYQRYITVGDPTSAGTTLGYKKITPGVGNFGLSAQEAFHLGFKFGYNPLNITRSLENIFSGAGNDLRYGNSEVGDNQFRDNDNKNLMGDFVDVAVGMNWNKLYGDLLSVGLSLRPLSFLSLYGGYAYGTCATQSCMAARFITSAGQSTIWTGGVTFALANNFFIYTQAMGLNGNVEFPRYDAPGYMFGQTNGYFNHTTITVGTMASF